MPFSKFSLPEPVDRDVWDRLASESRPIVVYGMGNGADKLFARFEERGIRAAAVFASDGFVRGQFFRGMRVMRFSEVRAAYPDFVIVLAFASDRPELLAAVGEMSRSNDLLVPDMPLAGGAYFDRAFYAEHWGEIRAAYDLFPDDESRSVYAAVVRNRLSGAVAPLLSCGSGAEEIFGLFDGVEHPNDDD